MERGELIERLESFKRLLFEWRSHPRAELRSQINQEKHWVRQEVVDAGCFKTMTIGPPPAVGGMIMQDVDLFEVMFAPPYRRDVIPDVIDMVDAAIGVMSKEPAAVTRTDGPRPRPSYSLTQLWGPVRVLLGSHFSFSAIKDIIALTGAPISELGHLSQGGPHPTAKGTLMDGVDRLYGQLLSERKEVFVRVVAEEVGRKSQEAAEELDGRLRRLGWQFVGGHVLPVEVIDPMDLDTVPVTSREDLTKAATRYRDGDMTGAVTAACAAVDSACGAVYAAKSLGDPAAAQSFQEKVVKALAAHGRLANIEREVLSRDWPSEEARNLVKNIEQSLRQAAYVMQSVRRRMSDAHGSQRVFEPLVFDCLKWAAIIASFLK